MISLKWQYSEIWSFLTVDIYNFYLVIHIFKKNETLDSWHSWLLSNLSRLLNWKELEPSPSPPNCSKDSWKSMLLLISISWTSLVTYWVVVQKIHSKVYLVSCTNTHHDVTGFVNLGIVKNTKTWISWDWIFLRNNKILNLGLRWYILRGYCFIAEITFKEDGLNRSVLV